MMDMNTTKPREGLFLYRNDENFILDVDATGIASLHVLLFIRLITQLRVILAQR